VRGRYPKCHEDTPYIAADRLGRTPWQINARVLRVVELYDKKRGVPGIPASPNVPASQRSWDWGSKRRAAEYADQFAGEYYQSRRILASARRLSDTPAFYCPHLADRRGRLYPGPSLSALSPDLGRGLLQFAESDHVHVDGPGYRQLAEYGATLWGIKEDGTGNRFRWAVDQGLRLAQSCVDNWPPDGAFLNADEPWQFLAWAFEWWELNDRGSVHSHFPCFIDGTANGLQMYALLLGDEDLAGMVNVLPNTAPRDVYTEVMQDVVDRLHQATEPEAREWLRQDYMDRSLFKEVLLALVFSQGKWGQRQSIADHLIRWSLRNNKRPKRGVRRMAWALQQVITEVVRERMPGFTAGQEFFKSLADRCATQGSQFEWVSPSGFPCQLTYERHTGTDKVNLMTTDPVRIRREGEWVPDRRAIVRGAAPNMIHSLDAAVLHGWAAMMPDSVPIAARHDGFGTWCTYVEHSRETLNDSLLAIPWRTFLQDLREATVARLPHGADVPAVPTRGTLDASVISQSYYAYH